MDLNNAKSPEPGKVPSHVDAAQLIARVHADWNAEKILPIDKPSSTVSDRVLRNHFAVQFLEQIWPKVEVAVKKTFPYELQSQWLPHDMSLHPQDLVAVLSSALDQALVSEINNCLDRSNIPKKFLKKFDEYKTVLTRSPGINSRTEPAGHILGGALNASKMYWGMIGILPEIAARENVSTARDLTDSGIRLLRQLSLSHQDLFLQLRTVLMLPGRRPPYLNPEAFELIRVGSKDQIALGKMVETAIKDLPRFSDSPGKKWDPSTTGCPAWFARSNGKTVIESMENLIKELAEQHFWPDIPKLR